ncbi:MAG: cytochrome oxidase putative small subunit CydP [Magnetospiraceae bacterium]
MRAVATVLLQYWGSAIRPKTPLARRIVPLLFFKLLAITAIWLLFFGPAQRPDMDDSTLENRLLQSNASISIRKSRDV